MNPNLQVDLTVRMPNGGKILRASVSLSEYLFEESFVPLPRERELPFAERAQIQAARQIQMRKHIANDFGKQLAATILKTIEAEDPKQGYSAEEWRRMKEPA